jgi:uncharacterized protein (DUF362 family)
MKKNKVVIFDAGVKSYPNTPFNPPEEYPELKRLFKRKINTDKTNKIYSSVRALFYKLGLDKKNYKKSNWNPLGGIIKKGDVVLLKPNFVKEKSNSGERTECLITHGSIIRAVLDYVAIALKGSGRIIIGDAPLQSSDFQEILKVSRLENIAEFYKKNAGIQIEIQDFRKEKIILDRNIVTKRIRRTDLKYFYVDLKQDSLLDNIRKDFRRYRVTNYDPSFMLKHHNTFTNEYIIPKQVLEADVIINLPKLKTHKKAGITACLKNMIGINSSKDVLPHHRRGIDEYLHKSYLKQFATFLAEKQDTTTSIGMQKMIQVMRTFLDYLMILFDKDGHREGSWYGNNTLWRTILDINRILFYCNKKGLMQETPQRKYLSIIDGVVAGEGEGPLMPAPKQCGVLIAGFDPVLLDSVNAVLMGFDYKKIPSVRNAFDIKKYPLTSYNPKQIHIISNSQRWKNLFELKRNETLRFRPAKGWRKHIELP